MKQMRKVLCAALCAVMLLGLTAPAFADVRPGDVIISTTLNHAMVVIGKIESGRDAGNVYTAEGNVSKKIDWTWKDPSNPYDYWNAWGLESLGSFTIYSRYPN